MRETTLALKGIHDDRAAQVSVMWLVLSLVSLVVRLVLVFSMPAPAWASEAKWSCATTVVVGIAVIVAAASPVHVSPVAAAWVLLGAAVLGAVRGRARG